MGADFFRFKQFTIHHDRCAMKVGTDGVLLGAWAKVEQAKRILDIGTGSGLIALMCAQRSAARVVGIEIDEAAARQAQENASASPFADRIEILHADVRTYAPISKFDCIVTNPPFYEEDILPPDTQRAQARNSATLDFRTLIENAINLLDEKGVIQMIIPYKSTLKVLGIAASHRLHLIARAHVISKPNTPPKRTLLTLSRHASDTPIKTEEILLTEGGEKSKQFHALTQDFYL